MQRLITRTIRTVTTSTWTITWTDAPAGDGHEAPSLPANDPTQPAVSDAQDVIPAHEPALAPTSDAPVASTKR